MELWVPVLGLVIAAAGLVYRILAAKWPIRGALQVATESRFKDTREYLKEHVHELTTQAISQQRGVHTEDAFPLLARPGWILPKPVPLGDVLLRLVEPRPADEIGASLARLRKYWPSGAYGAHMRCYHDAVSEYDPPTNWFNGASYRLLEVEPRDCTLHMTFSTGWYWDMFDTTEALAYEAALRHSTSNGRRIEGRYRRFLDDPFDLTRRCAIPGIDTITIRHDDDGDTFYVHRRDAKDVASAYNTVGIIPGGEFQPSDDSHGACVQDFNLWYNILREYSEEFLGMEEARHRDGAPIDYSNLPPYSQFNEGYHDGHIRPYLIGIGLDPLTWKPTILTVCVFDAGIFDQLFAAMVRKSAEGVLELPVRPSLSGVAIRGWPFEKEVVLDYAQSTAVLPAARAGLALAWQFRDELGLSREPPAAPSLR